MPRHPEKKTTTDDSTPADPFQGGWAGGCIAGFNGGYLGGSIGILIVLWLWSEKGQWMAEPFIMGLGISVSLIIGGAAVGVGIGYRRVSARRHSRANADERPEKGSSDETVDHDE